MILSRRCFIVGAAVVTVAVHTGCSGKLVFERDDTLSFPLSDDVKDVLYYASLAPSGHNTQPWLVEASDNFLIVSLDSSRALPAADPSLRETCISVGAFIENAMRAFEAHGYSAQLKVNEQLDVAINNPIVARIDYEKISDNMDSAALALMEKRHSEKSDYLTQSLKADALSQLRGSFPEMSYYEKGSTGFAWLQKATVDANIAQAADPAKRAELAEWLRFSNAEAEEKADGLPAEALGLSGIIKMLYYMTTDRESALSDKFAKQSVDKITQRVDNCVGFFTLTGGNTSHEAVLMGRRVQAFWLAATECGISLQPTSQILEEKPWMNEIDDALGTAQAVQMIFCAGYVKKYGENNRIRRPIERFVSQN